MNKLSQSLLLRLAHVSRLFRAFLFGGLSGRGNRRALKHCLFQISMKDTKAEMGNNGSSALQMGPMREELRGSVT